MDYTLSGKPIDLNKIKEIRTQENFYDPMGGTVLENYSYILTSPKSTQLTVHNKDGINIVTASENDSEVTFEKYMNSFRKSTFSVPFDMSNSLKECSHCKHKLKFISGIHQFIDRYAHLSNKPEGWIETKNQYYCQQCALYFVQIQRTFLVCTTGYYVLNTTLTDEKININSPKYRKPTVPLYYTKKTDYWQNPVYWDGKCIVCKTETCPFSEDASASVTGKFSLYGDSVCPNCNLLHHAEEHND